MRGWACLSPTDMPDVGYSAEFDRCWSNGMSERLQIRLQNWAVSRFSMSLKVKVISYSPAIWAECFCVYLA